jgi:hypothetical protein
MAGPLVHGVVDCTAGEVELVPFTVAEVAELDERRRQLEAEPAARTLEDRIADAAAAAVAAVLPALAPHADTAEVAGIARAAALDALGMRAAEPPAPPGGTGT